MKTIQVAKNEYVEEGALSEVLKGGETTLKTRFAIAYTDTGLKVRTITQTGGKTFAPFSGAGMPIWLGDVVEFFVSPYGDEKWYFELNVAPNGATFFARIFNPNNRESFSHPDIDCTAKADLHIENDVWTTELFVPYSYILKEGDENRIKELPWRFNVYRIDIAREEYAAFSPTGGEKANFHIPSKFAKMQLV